MKVFAEWLVQSVPENIGDIHISCGFGEEQWDGYFIHDDKAVLSIEHLPKDGYKIRLEIPMDNDTKEHIEELEEEQDTEDTDEAFWLSPNVWEEMTSAEEHATKYGLINDGGTVQEF